MICRRCQSSLRHREGHMCESRFHSRCVTEGAGVHGGEHRECGGAGGDRPYQWKCAVCKKSASGFRTENGDSKEIANLLRAINAISEKFELVNKIQLPKLNTDLAHLKSMTDRIAKQNEDILRKIDEMEKNPRKDRPCYSYRGRSLNVIPKSNRPFAINEHMPTAVPEKTVRFRTRRRSYLLYRMFHMLNRKMNKSTTPRRK